MTLDMVGNARYVRQIKPDPLEIGPITDSHEDQTGHFQGGFIPVDKAFVVERVEYQGYARGDSNGDGCFSVSVGGVEIVRHERIDSSRDAEVAIEKTG